MPLAHLKHTDTVIRKHVLTSTAALTSCPRSSRTHHLVTHVDQHCCLHLVLQLKDQEHASLLSSHQALCGAHEELAAQAKAAQGALAARVQVRPNDWDGSCLTHLHLQVGHLWYPRLHAACCVASMMLMAAGRSQL
jgi:hypothetical protein